MQQQVIHQDISWCVFGAIENRHAIDTQTMTIVKWSYF